MQQDNLDGPAQGALNSANPASIGMLVARARDGFKIGREVSINAVGTRGWVTIAALDYADESLALLKFIGRHGENEGAVFYIPAEALLAVRVAHERLT